MSPDIPAFTTAYDVGQSRRVVRRSHRYSNGLYLGLSLIVDEAILLTLPW